jgi:predicted AlkP superfamily pyrophosphatase or phosphodiesterase
MTARSLVLALLLFGSCAAAGEDAAPKPRLVVVISVDQLRPDVLRRYAKEYRGGLKRLLDGGLQFRGELAHAATQTGPGHSTMLTGCNPARTGIVANSWINRETLRSVYCVNDDASPIFLVKDKGRSPKQLLVTTLGDWMHSANPRARVFAVSGKDRAAITMGGKRPDGAYWFDRTAMGFTSSTYYHPDGMPDWLAAFNGDGWYDELPTQWTYEPAEGVRADDFPGESSRFSRTSPHPLRDADRRKSCDRIYCSPFVDAWTLRLAATLVERNDLGGDDVADLLCISLSATDTVGHQYGPFSQEIHDNLLRLDRGLGDLFALLDRRGAPYVVALTADHGVLPIPELTLVPLRPALQQATAAVQKKFGRADFMRVTGDGQVWLRPEDGLDLDAARETIAAVFRAQENVEAVIDPRAPGDGPLAELVRHTHHPERGADLYIIAKEKVLFSNYPSGTSHGSPWGYDRRVPLLFFGAGIPAGDTGRRARTIDIGPTLAHLLGVPASEGLDGSVLSLKK